MMGMEKDKGYAWLVVAASSFLMFIGPSTYTCYGSLFSGVDVIMYHTWIINIMCSLWFFTALLAGPMTFISSHRRVAMIGCFIGTCGLVLTVAGLNKPAWIFVMFSLLFGVGLGLAVNVTFLVVARHFEKYRGLANGILQVSFSVGHMMTPFLYSIIESPKDKLHIRAVLTAIAFLSCSLYFEPPTDSNSPSQKVTSRRSTGTSDRLPNCDLLEDIPLVEMKDSNAGQGSDKRLCRRRSQYLLAVSAALLPNIPEESENNSLSDMSASIDLSHHPTNENKTSHADTHKTNDGPHSDPMVVSDSERPNQLAKTNTKCLNQKSEDTNKICNGKDKRREDEYTSPDKGDTLDYSLSEKQNSHMPKTQQNNNIVNVFKDAVSQIDFKLLTNLQFLNMAVCCALIILTVPNVPITLYSYISLISPENSHEERETALLILFSIDMVSRLLVSYLSDFAYFNRRIAFFCATLCGVVVSVGLGHITNISIIYLMCAVYGVCMGAMVATESLMFVDVFGIEKVSTTYGVVNFFKMIGLLTITPLLRSPTSAFLYAFHPFSVNSNNSTITCEDCDPLGLLKNEERGVAIHNRQNMLLLLASPGIVCCILWTVEDIWMRSSRNRSRRLIRSELPENRDILPVRV